MRRFERLERRKQDILDGKVSDDPVLNRDADALRDLDEYLAAEIEDFEEELVDAATAARTVEELAAELLELAALVSVAKQVRGAGTDRKWVELRTILEDNALVADKDGKPRKLIISPSIATPSTTSPAASAHSSSRPTTWTTWCSSGP